MRGGGDCLDAGIVDKMCVLFFACVCAFVRACVVLAVVICVHHVSYCNRVDYALRVFFGVVVENVIYLIRTFLGLSLSFIDCTCFVCFYIVRVDFLYGLVRNENCRNNYDAFVTMCSAQIFR